MKYFVVNNQDNSILFSFYPEEAYLFKTYIKKQFKRRFGFSPKFHISEKSGVKMYIESHYLRGHKKERIRLQELKVNPGNSIASICSLFSIRIELWREDEISNCSICGRKYHESSVNLVDYQDDICIHCEQNYFKYEPIHKQGTIKYIAVYSFGGIIQFVQEGNNLQELAKKMRLYLKENGFDGEKDDARIFKIIGTKSEEVYSFTEEAYLIEKSLAEVYSQKDDRIVLLSNCGIKDDMVLVFQPKTAEKAV